MEKEIKIVEINGCKFEVDLSTARKVEEFRVGDKVKVLKKSYNDSYEVFPGIIIGFEWFESLPTITVAYLKIDYSEAKIEFVYYNSKTKDVELSHSQNTELLIEPSEIMAKMNKEIIKKEQEIKEIKTKQGYFLKHFGKFFNEYTDEKLQEMMKD